MMFEYKKLNDLAGWTAFLISLIVYSITVEDTASFWDAGEFIAVSSKLEVPHPPGAPFYLLLGRFFSMFAFGVPENIAIAINFLSVISSAFTILFLFWTITYLASKIIDPKLNNDNKTHVIVISGNGKGFSAGHNLKEVKGLKVRSKYLKLFNLCSKLMIDIVECRKPVIAKVHGSAYAAGCQLAASCDLTYCSTDAKFATPGVNIGLFCSTPMVAVSRKINRKRMMKMLLTGEPINAKYAKEIGLINDHFSFNNLEDEVLNLAENISSKSRKVVKIGKKAFYKQLEMPLDKAYKYTSQVMSENMMALDAKEGISAFIEKRKPNWKDK